MLRNRDQNQNSRPRMDSRGFSIVTVVIAIGILGALATGLAQLINASVSSQKLIQQRQAAAAVQLNMIGILSERQICENNFRNKTVANDTLTRLVSTNSGAPSPQVVLEEGVSYPNDALRAGNMRLANFRPYGTAGDDLSRGTVDLILNFEGTGSALNGTQIFRTVLLAVELNAYPPAAPGLPAGIKTCVAVGNDFNNLWKLKPSGDIYYQAFNVGIGTLSPTQRLEVSGNVLATAFLHSSDARLKSNVERLDGLGMINQLNGVRFNWNDTGEPAVGLIAQDVEKVLPEVVHTNPETGYKMVAYDQLVAPLIEANKALAKKIEKLEAQQEASQRKIQSLEQRLHNRDQ